MLFNSANLPYWIFLGIGILLFLLVILSGGGDDAEIEADLAVDSAGDFSSSEILGWLGIGQAPLSILLATDFSLWGLFGWMLNIWVGSLLGGIPTQLFGLGGVLLVVSLLLSLFSGSLIARPLGKIFASFGEDASSDRLIGCIGTVSSAFIPAENKSKVGQVDVTDSARNLVTISAVLPDWANIIPYRGQKVLVIERQSQIYLVVAKDSSDQERWMANSSRLKG